MAVSGALLKTTLEMAIAPVLTKLHQKNSWENHGHTLLAFHPHSPLSSARIAEEVVVYQQPLGQEEQLDSGKQSQLWQDKQHNGGTKRSNGFIPKQRS